MEFVTELRGSELVTKTIRYGNAPVQLRLIRADALICEVSAGSSTAPHLRRTRVFDGGGRGLLLVVQVAERWGSRQTSVGKTIRAEQPLPDERARQPAQRAADTHPATHTRRRAHRSPWTAVSGSPSE
ncbi:hypothetical protein AQJ91_40950 [Streptomyces dysideae]|uniref:Histidine kinase/HSP90-like ATPase domain-containing protein n=1 Tax=Streptomyces dysideae TaxID=909626 RepID=A0A101URD5_9ACTN|nr:hypothetical protein AQJ91_40950 [Streptomyces dysideae]